MVDVVQKALKQYREATHLDQKLEAAENLARHIAPKLHRYIRAKCPPAAVDDVLQEALIGIVKGLPKFKGDGQFEHWAFRIAKNKLANHLEGERRRNVQPMDVSEFWELIEASVRPSSPTAQERELLEDALSVVDEAKPPCRDYLTQRFIYGIAYKEIGKDFGKTAAAARQQVRRCIEIARALSNRKGATYA